jgi:hypothetical protein
MSAAAGGATAIPVAPLPVPYPKKHRVLNFLSGKAQYAIHELITAIPLDDDADIRTRLMYDDIRSRLIAGLRAAQDLYGMTAPPVRPRSPCPCGRGCTDDHD